MHLIPNGGENKIRQLTFAFQAISHGFVCHRALGVKNVHVFVLFLFAKCLHLFIFLSIPGPSVNVLKGNLWLDAIGLMSRHFFRVMLVA